MGRVVKGGEESKKKRKVFGGCFEKCEKKERLGVHSAAGGRRRWRGRVEALGKGGGKRSGLNLEQGKKRASWTEGIW